jgi:hypothetical protein
MRVLSQGRLARRIAQALLAAFLWSIAWMGAGVVPAGAQISTRATTAQSIAVAPFENLTTCQPETLGPEARSLVSDELQTRLMLDVLSYKDVDDAMAELGLKVPLTDSELVRLATELEVGMVVTGKVTHAVVVTENGQSYGEVTLAIALFDRAAETTVNGASATARSPASAQATADLIQKALAQAVFLAVQEMKTRPTVTAMVLWAKGNEIFTNSGTRAGVTEGMYMVAIRGGQRIATVKITSAEATGSYGKIVTGSPLQTGDHLRAMYQAEAAEPGLFVDRVVSGAKKHSGRIEKVAVAAGVLLGLAAYISSANDVVLGNFSTSGLRAANLANGYDLGESGWTAYYEPIPQWESENNPDDPEAGEFVVGDGYVLFDTAASLIDWEAPSGSQTRRVAAYFAFRDSFPVGGAFPTHDENWVLDTWASPPPGFVGAALGHITLDVIPGTGQIITGREFPFWDPDITIDATTGELTYNPEYNDWVDSTCTGVLNGITWGDTHVELWWQVIGPSPAEVYEYKVLPITIENIAGGNAINPQWRFVRNNWSYTTARRVTSVAPPAPSSPQAQYGQHVNVGADAVSVDMYKPLGADEMIVQIARDQGDDQPISFQANASGTITSLNLVYSGPTNQPVSIPISQITSLPGSTDVYWLRVGARNRSDNAQPLVWPPIAELTSSDPLHYDGGWVWWEQRPYQLTIGAGAASASAMKKQRDVLTNSRAGRGARIRRSNEGRELHVPR